MSVWSHSPFAVTLGPCPRSSAGPDPGQTQSLCSLDLYHGMLSALCSSSHFAVSVLCQWPLGPFFAGTLEKSLVCLSPKSPCFSASHCVPFAELMAGCCFPLAFLPPYSTQSPALSCPAAHSVLGSEEHREDGYAAGIAGIVWLVHPGINPPV